MVPEHPWGVPVAMRLIAPRGERCQCFIADPECRGVSILIECALEMPLGGPGGWLRARMAASRACASTVGCKMAGTCNGSILFPFRTLRGGK